MPGHVNELEYEVPWGELLAPRPSAGHIVGELLPPGFDRYLRVFHPFVPWDAEPDSSSPISHRASREDLANEAGVPFGPTLTWRQLEVMLPVSPVGQRRRWAVWDGYLEEAAADALFDSLNDNPNGSYFLAFGLVAIITTDEHRPVMYRADSLNARGEVLDRARRSGARPVTTPEYVWPENQSWIVCTDYDLTSTYIATAHDCRRCMRSTPAHAGHSANSGKRSPGQE